MAFAPEYVTYVLNEHFEDAKELFLAPQMAIHHAHLVMLAECGIIPGPVAREVREALDSISEADIRAAPYDGHTEDLFSYVMRLVDARCSAAAAGRLHTARSRNDVDMTMYRMRQREFILGLIGATQELRGVLLDIGDRTREVIVAAHTHTQPAQPTTVAHYLLAVVEQLERDGTRLGAAYTSTNRCPLGACAITGTGFSIDRTLTSRLLGFTEPTGNTYGSIATADYLLESTSAAAVTMAGLGRVIQDLLLWCTAEFGYLQLADGFVQCSSIMPQKRNPSALEHARAIGSKALGQAGAIMLSVHNTPFGDIVDTEDDLQPLVCETFRDATRVVRLVAASMAGAQFDVERLAARASADWITITELADTLAREYDVPFAASHRVASCLIRACAESPETPPAAVLGRVSHEVIGRTVELSDAALAELLSPERFVAVRRTHGGPAPDETARALAESRDRLVADLRAWTDRRDRLMAAEATLHERSAAL
jgi:argininosuccinate lyase